MKEPWTGSRRQFEAHSRWQATIRRDSREPSFILKGHPSAAGRYFEYQIGFHPERGTEAAGFSLDDIAVDLRELHRLRADGSLVVLKGNLPPPPD